MAILDKKLKIFIFSFVSFNSFFFKITPILILHLGVAFEKYEVYENLLNIEKAIAIRKINGINKNFYFS